MLPYVKTAKQNIGALNVMMTEFCVESAPSSAMSAKPSSVNNVSHQLGQNVGCVWIEINKSSYFSFLLIPSYSLPFN